MADEDLREQLARLSADQRRELAKWLADEAPAIAPGSDTRLIAWIVPDGPHDPRVDELREGLRARLPDYMQPHRFVAVDALPRSTGGKLDRAALQRAAPTVATAPQATGEDPATDGAANEVESVLAEIWAEVLGLEYVGVNEDFFELGGDSLLSIRILSRARRAGLALSPERFFAHPTVAGQAREAAEAAAGDASGPASGGLPLTPIQHWFFERTPIDPQHWNQCFVWRLDARVTPDMLARASQYLLEHHDALRLRFAQTEAGWQARIAAPGEPFPLATTAADGGRHDTLDQAVDQAASALNRGFDLSNGPLAAMVLIDTPGDTANRLIIAIHHLAIDALSWRILVEDLDRLCRQLLDGVPFALAARSNSCRIWAERLLEHANADSALEEAAYWRTTLAAGSAALPNGGAQASETNTVDSAASMRLSLDRSTTSALTGERARRNGVRPLECLLAAVAWAMARWRDADTLVVDLEGHGRENLFFDVDVSRTIGWFTSVFPFPLTAGDNAHATLERVTGCLRELPRHGIGHGLLRYLYPQSPISRELAAAPPRELCFNFLGTLDQAAESSDLLVFERELRQWARSPRGRRAYVLEINAWIAEGCIEIDWQYSRDVHPDAVVRTRVEDCEHALRELAAGMHTLTPSPGQDREFPLAGLDEGEYSQLAAMLEALDDGAPKK